ncbi:MAG: hypothetical protein COX29_00070 [Candidatus Moranbacteria bacterium CG23_combo_of_CG06-09_8_20_14_all_35_22]|nr:MAG: hypothetical protein COX29_00070 [Candidatus Moranbacteria bacterium CG23_combo_of_CG06-09_8_20_14_all_35_22]
MLAKKRKKIKKIQKTPKQMERHLKGVANHRRIEILFLIEKEDGITLDRICDALKGNPKTLSQHTQKLVQAGLINKYRRGRGVGHILSPYGKRFFKFIKTF